MLGRDGMRRLKWIAKLSYLGAWVATGAEELVGVPGFAEDSMLCLSAVGRAAVNRACFGKYFRAMSFEVPRLFERMAVSIGSCKQTASGNASTVGTTPWPIHTSS